MMGPGSFRGKAAIPMFPTTTHSGATFPECATIFNAAGRDANEKSMIDPFGRTITYLRVSVTDRCDFRCVYCMAEEMNFLPKAELLTLEELDRVCSAFVRLGVKLTLTTNGSQLVRYAGELYECGVRRVNVSVDTLDPAKFAAITRRGHLETVLKGLAAAKAAGLAVKINTVALRGVNEDELDDLVAWTGEEGFDLVVIEVMPMGDIGGENRLEQYLPLSLVRARLQRRWTLDESDYRTGGPARYVTVRETGRRLGFITPLTHNFCESCNRVRMTCTGTLYMCLGQEDAADLRAPLRQSEGDEPLEAAIREAIDRKPRGHDFIIDRRHNRPAVARHMSVTGG